MDGRFLSITTLVASRAVIGLPVLCPTKPTVPMRISNFHVDIYNKKLWLRSKKIYNSVIYDTTKLLILFNESHI